MEENAIKKKSTEKGVEVKKKKKKIKNDSKEWGWRGHDGDESDGNIAVPTAPRTGPSMVRVKSAILRSMFYSLILFF